MPENPPITQSASPVPANPVWDVLSGQGVQQEIQALEAREQEEELDAQQEFNRLQANPNQLRLWLMAFIAVPMLAVVAEIGTHGEFPQNLLMLSFLPLFLYYIHFSVRANMLVKETIARQKGWIYSSVQDSARWVDLAAVYPTIFNKGDNSQNVSDEFWGSVALSNQAVPFWMSNFTYSIGSGKNRETYYYSVYAFPLPKVVGSNFQLEPRSSLGAELGQLFSGQAIKTEWVDFNKAFVIEYNGLRSQDGPQIFETLNPIIQEKIMALHQGIGDFSLIFTGAVMIVQLHTQIKPVYTNLMWKMAIDPRDITMIEDRLQKILSLGADIVPYIN